MTFPYPVQLCLVSDQATPNLLPALEPRFASALMVLIVSNDRMHVRATQLKMVLERHHKKVEIKKLRSDSNFQTMKEDFVELASAFPHSMLNATGGKKTMSLAAYEAYIGARLPVFYVERNNEFQWLANPPAGWVTNGILHTELSMEDILTAYNQTIHSVAPCVNPSWVRLASKIFQSADQYGVLLPQLMFTKEHTITAKQGQSLTPKDVSMLHEFSASGVLKFDSGHWRTTAAGAKFLAGEWLETHVAQCVQNMVSELEIHDVRAGLKIHSIVNYGLPVENEIDVAFVRHNQLYIIECKAQAKKKPLADFIYTLESVSKHGGLTTKAALLTWGGPPGLGSQERAKNNRIELVDGERLARLEESLTEWIEKS